MSDAHPNDGEVICKRCRRKLDRTDLNCYACGSKELDRSKVEGEIPISPENPAALWGFDVAHGRYYPVKPGDQVPPSVTVFDARGQTIKLIPLPNSYNYQVPTCYLEAQQRINDAAYAKWLTEPWVAYLYTSWDINTRRGR